MATKSYPFLFYPQIVILLLYYFVGMNDREIGEMLNLMRETVQYRRTSSLRQIKQYSENLLSYSVIVAATTGDVEALQAVFRHYAGYITKLSMRPFIDDYGNRHFVVDEDIRIQLENHLAAAIVGKFRVARNG